MKFDKAFPLRFWVKLGRREDRRFEMEARLDQIGITAERFAAVDARFVRERPEDRIKRPESKPGARRPGNDLERDAPATLNPAGTLGAIAAEVEVRGYESAGRYALALTQRLAVREAARREAPAHSRQVSAQMTDYR